MQRHFRLIVLSLTIFLAFLGFAISPTVTYAQAVVVNPPTIPNGQVGVAYSQTFTASGGVGGVCAAEYSVAFTGGTIPPGLTFSAGVLSGTPTTAGFFTFTISGFDLCAGEGTRDYTIEITGGAINLSPSTLPSGEVTIPYGPVTITVTGGATPYTFAVTAGALPAGVTLSPTTGVISGTPTADGTFNFTITVEDGDGRSGSRAYSIIIAPSSIPVLSPTTLPNGTVGTFYSQTITATGGELPYTFTVTSGSLPDGLTLADTTGLLSGTPTNAGPFTFTITATDSNDATGQQSYTVTINPSPITLSPATLPDGTVGTPYNQTFTASGGTPDYTFAVTGVGLPGGLTLDPDGSLSGTPTAGGSFNFTITATDSASISGAQPYTLFIANPGVTISPETLPDGTLDVPYSQSLSVTGGRPPYIVSQSGALPPGLTFDTGTLLLSGTPTTAGTFNFSVTADDDDGRSDTNNYALTIIDPNTDPGGGEEPGDGEEVAAPAPPPPPVPLCAEHNFDEGGVVRSSAADALGYAINCRVLYQNGAPTQWVSTPDNGASIGVEGILDLGVQQAVDIFSPSGVNHFEGGAVFCLKGSGYLIWLAASQSPRHAEIIGSYEVPEFPGFTCATLFEPGTLVLVTQNPVR